MESPIPISTQTISETMSRIYNVELNKTYDLFNSHSQDDLIHNLKYFNLPYDCEVIRTLDIKPMYQHHLYHSKKIELPLISDLLHNYKLSMKINDCQWYGDFACNIDEFLSGRDSHMLTPYHSSLLLYLYGRDASIQLNSVITFPYRLDESVELSNIVMKYYQDRNVEGMPESLACLHTANILESTSGISDYLESYLGAASKTNAVKHAILTFYHTWFTKEKFDELFISKESQAWLLELGDLIVNFSISKLFFSFLKIINAFMPLTSLLSQIQSLMSYVYDFVIKKWNDPLNMDRLTTVASTQPLLEGERTNLETCSETLFSNYVESLPAIAAAMSTIIVTFASVLVGKSVFNASSHRSVAVNLAETLKNVAYGKSGIYAFISMIKDFSTYMYQTVFDLVSTSTNSVIYNLIMSTSIKDTEEFQKTNFFNYLEFLIAPSNLLSIQQNSFFQKQLTFVIKIIDEIILKIANENYFVKPVTLDFFKQKRDLLHAINKQVLKRPKVDAFRFCPFWINIVGKPGVGKSVFVPLLNNYLKEILPKMDIDLETPEEGRWIFPVNFTDKYLTHYNGHYVVTVDDFLQDSPGHSDNPTALSIISWVSSVPHYTVQAAIDDKGTPFTSKIVITTSNTKTFGNRFEITTPDALKRRMRMFVEIVDEFDKQNPVKSWNIIRDDPLLNMDRPVAIRLIDAESCDAIKYYKSASELIEDVIENYVNWYKHQKDIMQTRAPKEEIVNTITDNLFKKMNVVNKDVASSIRDNILNNQTAVKVSTCAGIACMMGLSPSLIDYEFIVDGKLHNTYKIWNCDCDYHEQENIDYRKYIQFLYDREMSAVKSIAEFTPHNGNKDSMLQNLRSQFHKGWNTTKEVCKFIWDHPVGKYILAMLTTLGTAAITFAAYKAIGSKSNELENIDIEPSKAQYNVSKPKRATPKIMKLEPLRLETKTEIEDILPETISKQTYDLAFNQIIKRDAICQVYRQNHEGLMVVNAAIRVGGRAILTNNHFMSFLNQNDEFTIKINGVCHKQFFNESCYYRINKTDVVLYELDGTIPMSKSLLKHFPDDDMLFENMKSLIVTKHPMNSTSMVLANVIAQPQTINFGYNDNGDSYTVLNTWLTNCEVEKGMSGSILVATGNRLQNKILGLLVCRNQHNFKGYFQPITRSQLEKGFEVLGVKAQDTLESLSGLVPIEDDCCPPNLANGALIYKGTIPKNKRIKGQTKTKYLPSLIQNCENIAFEPSVLNDHDDRMDEELQGKSVIFRAFEGFNHEVKPIDRFNLDRAVDELKVEYDINLSAANIANRLLTDEEMINGIPGIINRVEMKSSPGYPYVLERTKTTMGGKYEWFDEITPEKGSNYGKLYVMKEDLARGLEQREKDMLAGRPVSMIAYACLKDETRPLSKIESGKTRAFICLPLDYNLLIRKYFGAFIASLHQNAGIVTSCVGIDPAKQWKDLYNKLASKNGKEWEDFDYANWDQHLHPELVLSVAKIVNYYYGDKDESEAGNLRYMLLYDLVFTNIIVKDRLFQKQSGQCSGCAITAELNCVVHDILMYYVWLKMNEDRGTQTTLNEYRECVSSIMYGDDIVQAVIPEESDWFCGTNIQPYMKQLGMNITPGDKTSTTFTRKPPHEILFLKRAFVKDEEDGEVYAPLRSDIVYNITQWIHKSDDDYEATRLNCETALRESFMHGKKYYDEFLLEVNDRIKRFNLNSQIKLKPIAISYEALKRQYRDDEYLCAGLSGLVMRDASSW